MLLFRLQQLLLLYYLKIGLFTFFYCCIFHNQYFFFFYKKNFNSNDNTNNNDRRADVYDACCRPLRSALVGYEQLEYDRIIVDYLPLMSRSSASVLSLLLLLIKLVCV